MLRLLVGPSGKTTLLFNFFEVNRLVIASPYFVLAESSFITFGEKKFLSLVRILHVVGAFWGEFIKIARRQMQKEDANWLFKRGRALASEMYPAI